VVDLTSLDLASGAVWDALLDLATKQPQGWTLVGAQMVALHGHERGRILARSTVDADLLVNVRAVQEGTAQLSQLLIDSGFELEGVDAFGVGHRFTDGRVKIDVLAPDGLAKGKPELTITIPPAHTVSVPGGTQALRRSRPVEIKRGERTGHIPRPDLLGAILVKTRAVEVDDLPEAQLSDLAFLLGLIEDPRQLATQFQGKERGWLRRRKELLEREHPAWRDLPQEEADGGHIAFRIMTGL
jgi:hypothetical protein